MDYNKKVTIVYTSDLFNKHARRAFYRVRQVHISDMNKVTIIGEDEDGKGYKFYIHPDSWAVIAEDLQ